MDRSEAAIEKLLAHMGFSKIVYEPDGNVPPDFVVDGHIAVEVRRLNQNFDAGSGKRGLEEVATPLWQRMTRFVESIAETDGNSWYVFYTFSRPVPSWKSIEPELLDALLEFKASAIKHEQVIYSAQNFRVRVAKASTPLETFFRMGGVNDRQAGGWVIAELISNIQHCAAEKLTKIDPYRGRYKTWWLALTNYTGFGLNEHDRQELRRHLVRPDGWDKILVINPSDPEQWLEF
jgi:hypothetical protein